MSIITCDNCECYIDTDFDTEVWVTKDHNWLCFSCLDYNPDLADRLDDDSEFFE